MKSITEILGDHQMLLDISYDIQEVFEDYLTKMHRSFLALLRLIEDFIPPINENRAVTGRKPYAMMPFIRAFLAKSFFRLGSNKDLILRLQSDSSLKRKIPV